METKAKIGVGIILTPPPPKKKKEEKNSGGNYVPGAVQVFNFKSCPNYSLWNSHNEIFGKLKYWPSSKLLNVPHSVVGTTIHFVVC